MRPDHTGRQSGVPAELLLNIWNLTILISLMILLSISEFLSQCCILSSSTDGHGFAKVYLGTDLPRTRAKPLGLLRFGGKTDLTSVLHCSKGSTLFQNTSHPNVMSNLLVLGRNKTGM